MPQNANKNLLTTNRLKFVNILIVVASKQTQALETIFHFSILVYYHKTTGLFIECNLSESKKQKTEN